MAWHCEVWNNIMFSVILDCVVVGLDCWWFTFKLTHWPLGDLNEILVLVAIFKLISVTWLSMLRYSIPCKITPDECHWTLLMASQYWLWYYLSQCWLIISWGSGFTRPQYVQYSFWTQSFIHHKQDKVRKKLTLETHIQHVPHPNGWPEGCLAWTLHIKSLQKYRESVIPLTCCKLVPYFEGILPKGPYLPCLRMADRALLAGYPRLTRPYCSNQTHIWGPGKKVAGSKGPQTVVVVSCVSLMPGFQANGTRLRKQYLAHTKLRPMWPSAGHLDLEFGFSTNLVSHLQHLKGKWAKWPLITGQKVKVRNRTTATEPTSSDLGQEAYKYKCSFLQTM